MKLCQKPLFCFCCNLPIHPLQVQQNIHLHSAHYKLLLMAYYLHIFQLYLHYVHSICTIPVMITAFVLDLCLVIVPPDPQLSLTGKYLNSWFFFSILFYPGSFKTLLLCFSTCICKQRGVCPVHTAELTIKLTLT